VHIQELIEETAIHGVCPPQLHEAEQEILWADGKTDELKDRRL
jgi:hypothetical protein